MATSRAGDGRSGIQRAVTYVGLPVSSGGAHSLGTMPRRVAYERTMGFLDACTASLDVLDHRFRLQRVPDLEPPVELARALRATFGDDVALPTSRVPDALDFLDSIDPQPANRWGMVPVWFWTAAAFRILDPATGRPLDGQDPERYGNVEYEPTVPLGTSGLHLILNDHAALGVELCIPAGDDDLVRRVVPWLQEHLPFRFSPKQWREWAPTRTGTWKARRLPATPGR
jgi:hypothetical protein